MCAAPTRECLEEGQNPWKDRGLVVGNGSKDLRTRRRSNASKVMAPTALLGERIAMRAPIPGLATAGDRGEGGRTLRGALGRRGGVSRDDTDAGTARYREVAGPAGIDSSQHPLTAERVVVFMCPRIWAVSVREGRAQQLGHAMVRSVTHTGRAGWAYGSSTSDALPQERSIGSSPRR